AIRLLQIDRFHMNLFLIVGTLVENSSKGVGDKRSAPELHRAVLFQANAVYAHYVHAIRNGMATLNGLPRGELFIVCLFVLRRSPTDSRWIEKNLSAHQRRNPCTFRIPLIPADQHANGCELRFENLVTQIARREVKFLVICRIIRNVHLTILAEVSSIGVKSCGSVMVKSFRSFFE